MTAATAASAAVQQAAAPRSATVAKQVASAAGHGMPPAGAHTATKVTKSMNVMEEIMGYGKKLASSVAKGTKGSKNVRMAGLAALAAGAGWAAERAKGHQQTANADYNKEQQIKQQLMSDG
jgi:hypothetical protein